MKLKNTSNLRQCFSGMRCFDAGETREVSKETAVILLRNPFIEKVGTKKKTTAKSTEE